ncbi:hydrogenase subunit MbhD domain-containing protein [Methanocalculus sp. MC3]
MIEIILHAFILAGMIVSAVLVFKFKDLISAAVAFGLFSFLLAIEFYLLQAPDVAIAEAAIGAGLTTAAFMIAIRGTTKTEGDEA